MRLSVGAVVSRFSRGWSGRLFTRGEIPDAREITERFSFIGPLLSVSERGSYSQPSPKGVVPTPICDPAGISESGRKRCAPGDRQGVGGASPLR